MTLSWKHSRGLLVQRDSMGCSSVSFRRVLRLVSSEQILSAILFCFFVFMGKLAAEPGQIRLRNGDVFSGEVRCGDQMLTLVSGQGGDRKWPLEEIQYVRFQSLEAPPVTLEAKEEKGLEGTYFSEPGFTGKPSLHVDPQIQFHWGTNRVGEASDTGFSVRWEGQLVPSSTGIHQFQITSSGNAQLWLDRQSAGTVYATNEWRQSTMSVHLLANRRYDFVMEFSHSAGDAKLDLAWSTPGMPWTTIPAGRFLHKPQSTPSKELLQGVLATYYANPDFTAPKVIRIDRSIDWDWKSNAPFPEAGIGSRFSATWTGTLKVPRTGAYRIAINTDGGTRLSLDGVIIYERWEDVADTTGSIGTAPLDFDATKSYALKVDFFNEVGRARLNVSFFREGLGEAPRFSDGLTPSAPADRSRPVTPPPENGGKPSVALNTGSLSPGVVLREGSLFAQKPESISKDQVQFKSTAPLRSIPLSTVARVYLGEVSADVVQKLDPNRPGAYLHTGDFIEGDFMGLDDKELKLGSILFGNRGIERDRVLVIVLKETNAKSAYWSLSTRDGSVLRGEGLQVSPNAIRLTGSPLASLLWNPSEVTELRWVSSTDK